MEWLSVEIEGVTVSGVKIWNRYEWWQWGRLGDQIGSAAAQASTAQTAPPHVLYGHYSNTGTQLVTGQAISAAAPASSSRSC